MTDPLQWHDSDGGGTVSVRATGLRLLVIAVTALVLIKLLDVLGNVGFAPPLVREIVGVAFLTFVPGLLLLVQFGYDGPLTATVCYAFGLSISFVMAVGGVVSVLFPLVGFDTPLSLDAILVTWLLLSGVTALTARGRSVTVVVDTGRLRRPIVPLLLLLVPVSILGSVFYHTSGNNIVLLGLLLGIAAIPLLAATIGEESWYYPLAIWCLSLALLYHGRVPGVYTVTQPLPELTLAQLRWIPNAGSFGSLLANGVLFPTYAIVTDLPIGVEWNLVNPVLVSLLPVTLYEVFRRFVRPTEALVAVCLFVFSYPFYVLYPGAGRAATPVVFIALVGLAYSDSDLPVLARRVLMLVFGAGIVVSHYGTAYVVLFSLLVGFVSFVGLSILVRVDVPSMLPDRYSAARSDGGGSTSLLAGIPAILTPSYLAFYSVFTLGWYIYTANSEKFVILPRKIVDAIEGVLYVEATGSTASSYTQSYAATTITIGKYFYVLLGLLMMVGIGVAIVRLVVFHDESIELGYLAVAIGFFSMFIGSILPSGNGFAVARVMMIIFTFSIPFAVVGARELGTIPARIVSRLGGGESVLPDRSVSLSILSVGVALFLLLNVGVVSETVTGDVAPSNRISQERLLDSEDPNLRLRAAACTQCNVQTHAWVAGNLGVNDTIYGDIRIDNQRDYYRGTLASEGALGLRYKPIQLNQTDLPNGTYLHSQQYSDDLGGFAIGYKFFFFEKNMTAFTDGSRLYSSGHGAVYYENREDDVPPFAGNGTLGG